MLRLPLAVLKTICNILGTHLGLYGIHRICKQEFPLSPHPPFPS